MNPNAMIAMKNSVLIGSPLLLFLIIVCVVVVAARRSPSFKPEYHHWIVRILCAVLFVAGMVAVGVGTWQGTRLDSLPPSLKVKVPTKAPRSLDLTKNPGNPDLGPCRLIGTVFLARQAQDRLLPVCGESQVLEWPPGPVANLVFRGEHNGSTYTVVMDLREFVCFGQGSDVRSRNGVTVVMKGAGWSGSTGGGTLALETLGITNFGFRRDALDHAPLSVIPSGSAAELCLAVHLARADRDDPLEEVPVGQWLAGQTAKPRQELNSYPGVRYDADVPPGIRMLVFLGPPVVLLGFAAIAGSAVFRRGRRAPAFAGLLAIMVLYAGLLDGLVLQRRASLTKDAGQPENVRLTALADMYRGTFFHSGAAAARIRGIVADQSIPRSLREYARAMISE